MITADDIIACGPCRDWPHDEIRRRVGAGLTPLQVAEDDTIEIADRRWVLTEVLARRDRPALARWAAACARDVLPLVADEHRAVAEAAILAAEAWADDPTEERRVAANAAARAAAGYAEAAARAAAWAADATRAAAWAAAAWAARAAAAWAARAAADRRYLLDLVGRFPEARP